MDAGERILFTIFIDIKIEDWYDTNALRDRLSGHRLFPNARQLAFRFQERSLAGWMPFAMTAAGH
jgi:hypothetical protein